MEKDLDNGCIMILGAPNDNKGHLSLMAKTRLILGSKELALNPGFRILLTGGFGQHFNQTNLPHWHYAKEFLIKELSISPHSFLPEAIESTNTMEDIEMARPIFLKYNFEKIILVTSEFHLKRVQYIVEKAFGILERKFLFSYVSDNVLNNNLLEKLHEHEKQALEYLRIHY